MAESLKSIQERKAALRREFAELEAMEREAEREYGEKRKGALLSMAADIVKTIQNGDLNVVHVGEGVALNYDAIQSWGPRERRGQAAIQLYSAHERKGHMSPSDSVDYLSKSSQRDQIIVAQFIFPRADFAEALGRIEALGEKP